MNTESNASLGLAREPNGGYMVGMAFDHFPRNRIIVQRVRP